MVACEHGAGLKESRYCYCDEFGHSLIQTVATRVLFKSGNWLFENAIRRRQVFSAIDRQKMARHREQVRWRRDTVLSNDGFISKRRTNESAFK